MSPLPSRARLGEYGTKAAHALLREVNLAPEEVRARQLVRATPAAGAGTGPRVLFLSPRNWAAHVQWEAMIGHALQQRGATVSFSTCGGGLEICDRANTWEAPPMPCRTCSGYVHQALTAHGFAPTQLADGWADDDGTWPELDELSLRELADVTADGLPLGRLVEIPVKWFLMRASIEDDPLGPVTYRRFLRSARRIAVALRRELERQRPDVVVLCNGLFLFEAIASELCRETDIDVVTYERGMIKETLVFRRGAPACLLDIGDLWKTWMHVPLTEAENVELDAYLDGRRQGLRTIDRYWNDAVFEQVEQPTEGRLVTLFPNLTWDSAVIGQELAFPSLLAWVTATVDAFARRPGHQLVIRVHPAETKLPGKQTREPVEEQLRLHLPNLPANVRVIGADDPQSSYPLIAASDAVLTFTSTTGLEASLLGKPVIVSGTTHYRDKGFTLDVSTPEEFEQRLDDVLAEPERFLPDATLARRYAYLFFFRAPVATPGVEEHVLGLARITVGSLDELAPGRNPDVDRICDGILGLGDFGPPAPSD